MTVVTWEHRPSPHERRGDVSRPHRPHRRSSGIGAVAAIALAAFAVLPATAADSAPAPSPDGNYCATRIHAADANGKSATTTQCFATYSDSLFVATGGRLRVSLNFKPSSLNQALLDAASGPQVMAASNWVIGQDWKGANRTSTMRTYYVTTDGPPCTNTVWEIDQLEWGWDNAISSGEGFSGCDRFEHWELANQQGASKTCTTYCATMGVMDNATTSLRWRD